jgi:hypothetical protein
MENVLGTSDGLFVGLNRIFESSFLSKGMDSGSDWLVPLVIVYSLMAFSVLFCAVKGKYGFVLLGMLIPVIGIPLCGVGAVRLAKPRSWWARHMYDRKVMLDAIDRHEPPIDLDSYPEPKLRRGFSPPTEDSTTS